MNSLLSQTVIQDYLNCSKTTVECCILMVGNGAFAVPLEGLKTRLSAQNCKLRDHKASDN